MTDTPDDDIDVFEQVETGKPAERDQRWEKLPPCGMLSIVDTEVILRWRPASFIAIIGERNGGKTTLVTEIYERFLRGPFAGNLFTQSLSLIGFEQKSFQSRAESKAEMPDTARTSKRDGLGIFHLAVTDERHLRRRDLLLTERAGEVYREVRDEPARVTELLEVKKAETIALIIDGERVADNRRRAEVFASVRNFLRVINSSDVISSPARLQLVTTKCDLLVSDEASTARDLLNNFEEGIKKSNMERFTSIEVFHTAARDPLGVIEPGHGLGPLLNSWLQPQPVRKNTPTLPSPELTDEFDLLLLRRSI